MEGRWHDRRLGEMLFADYVENVWFPSKHLELSTRAGYRYNLDKHFIPFFGTPTDGQDPALPGPGVGDQGYC